MNIQDPNVTCRLDTATEHDTVVRLQNVGKSYRQVQRPAKMRDAFRYMLRPQVREIQALYQVNLEIQRGEIVAYAGPNGAGKSTTVKLLAGILAPDSGAVQVLGMNPLRDRIRYVGRIGVVFGQRRELWWDHPVAASYEWKRVVWDIPPDRYRRSLGFLREVLGLDEFFHSLARELSLGQRMRADLGLALLHEPEILFLDEPTIGVDVLAKRRILQFVKELNQERKMTVLLTSHDMSELEQLAGRIVMISGGRIAFDGEFTHLRRAYGDRRRLRIETTGGPAPRLSQAALLASNGNTFEYAFNSAQVNVVQLLNEAGNQVELVDVETSRADIDEVIADIYESWQQSGR